MSWSWVDFVILAALAGFVWMGFWRGVIMEFFELLMVTVNLLLCSWLYGIASYAFVTLLHTPSLVAGVISYTVFYAFFAVVFWILAGKAQVAANFPPYYPPNNWGGFFFAFLKGIFIVWIFLFVLAQIPVSKDSRDLLHVSPTVGAVQSLTPIIDSAFEAAGSPRAYHTMHPLIEKSVF